MNKKYYLAQSPAQRLVQRKLQLEIDGASTNQPVFCYLVASQQYLYGIFWHEQAITYKAAAQLALLDETELQIVEFWRGQRTAFDLPIQLQGTKFQQLVWQQLRRIPYGQTRSYKEIATAIATNSGQEQYLRACRAVGAANSKNPLNLLVPCHRVIAANGSLGGYAGGLGVKQFLLELESV